MNLRSLVNQVLDSSDDADPELVVADVLGRVSNGQERSALEQALPAFVQSVISSRRSSLGATPMPAPIPGQGVAFHQRGVTVMDGWQRAQRDRVKVPEVGWKFLGETTAEDLRRIADHLDGLANAHRTKARRYRALEAAVIEHGVKQVDELPAEVLMPLLGGKA